MRPRLLLWLLLVVPCVALASCSSSGGGARNPGSDAARGSIKIGFLTDLTGVSSSGFTTSERGVKAYVNQINRAGGVNGRKIEYVMADTTSTMSGALTAVQKLVQYDHVFAIVDNSTFVQGAEPWALANGIPIVGSGVGGPIWTDPRNSNLFMATGVADPDYMALAQGRYMKAQGVTRCASIGYAGAIPAQKAAAGFVKSCEAAGLQEGYLNTEVPFGSTDVGPIALAIKNSHSDGLYLPLVPSTAFALAAQLRQLGVKMKSVLLAIGYGGDLLASKAGVAAGQGLDFIPTGTPAEANTAATKREAAALAKVGVNGPPTFAEQTAYIGMSALVAGLKAAGPNPTPQGLRTAMDGITDFDADGLLAPTKVNFRDYHPGTSCLYVVRLTGDAFKVRPGTPICAPTQKFSG